MPFPVKPPTTYAVVPMLAAAPSERGCGSAPTVVVRRPFQLWTSATVVAAPPPKTTAPPPSTAPLASCTGVESVPTCRALALPVSIDQMRPVVVSPAANPPSASNRPPEASSTVRETPTGRWRAVVTDTVTDAVGDGAGRLDVPEARGVDVAGG